ncbi:Alcohol dehydrogenase family protein [Desulfonema limicola]|uniref:Alcohol dehydrogenase family protein n=1 Tax=Desulfonema limicola TaxID=45656 RepID=A0A975B6F9_9BACT|nr:alcohol dehydrogenase catalytic domain-containing protein [Desulfonema limicola]QTA79657.1 Alcohol dehydrogenase family protein [Desulfonema limicola]
MKSLILEKTGLLKQENIPIPVCSNTEVLFKITHCALCRTDAKMWKSGHRDLILPRILGHEICGFIENQKDKPFVVWPGKSCCVCAQCSAGYENLCDKMEITGFHKHGGLAEYAAVPVSSLIPVPENLPKDLACLAEPAACALNALEQAEPVENKKVLIYGAGPVGLLTAIAAVSKKAEPFIFDINPQRMEQAAKILAGLEIEITETYKDFDIVINASPSPDTFLNGLKHLKPNGVFCLFSGLTGNHSFSITDINEIHYRQLRLTGAYGCTFRQMEKALKILSDYKTQIQMIIESHIKLEDVQAVFEKILSGTALKHVVVM